MHKDFEDIVNLKLTFKNISDKAQRIFLATNGRGSFSREGVQYQCGKKKVTQGAINELIKVKLVEVDVLYQGIQYYQVTDYGKEVYRVI